MKSSKSDPHEDSALSFSFDFRLDQYVSMSMKDIKFSFFSFTLSLSLVIAEIQQKKGEIKVSPCYQFDIGRKYLEKIIFYYFSDARALGAIEELANALFSD